MKQTKFTQSVLLLLSAYHAGAIQLPSPKNFMVTEDSVTDTSLFLTWESVAKADSYTIGVMPPTVGTVGIGTGITDRFTRIQGLDPDTEYTFRLMAVKDGLEGIAAVVWARTALPAPEEIFALQDQLTSESMQIAWTEVDKAETYVVDVQPSSGVSGAGNAIYKTSTTLRGLTPNTQYTIVVRPRNWVALGGDVILHQYTKLPAPTGVRIIEATVSHDTVAIQWDQVNGAMSYLIELDPHNPGITGDGGGIKDTLTTIRGLKADQTYTINIMSVNDAGASRPMALVAKTLSICYARANDYLGEDRVSVECPARCSKYQEHVYGSREYTDDSYICASAVHDGRIDDSLGGEVTIKKRTSGLTHYIGTLQHGVNSKDYGAWSKSFVFALYAPKELQVVPGTISHEGATIEWQVVSGAEDYQLAIRKKDAPIISSEAKQALKDNRANLNNLEPDTNYVITVLANNVIETSDDAEVEFKTALPAPSNLRVTQVTKDSIHLTWDAIPSNVNSYTVTYYKDGNGMTHDLGPGQTSVNIDYLHSGTEYKIDVRAINEIGRGGIASIHQYTKLDTPKMVNAEQVASKSLLLKWNQVEGANYYRIEVTPCCPRIESDSKIMVTQSWLEDLMPNTKYNLTVFAHNDVERSLGSNLNIKTALPPPLYLRAANGTVGHTYMNLEWERIIGAAKYQISVRTLNGEQVNSYSVDGNKTLVNITGLTSNTAYIFKLNGVNDVGDGAENKFYTTTLIAPPMGLIVQADPDYPDRVLVSWQKRDGIMKYRMYAEPGENVVGTGDVEGERAVIAGLDTGNTYTIHVAALSEQREGANATTRFTTALPPPAKVWINPSSITPFTMEIEWSRVEKASSYEVTYNNLDTESVKTITGVSNLRAQLIDMEPASRYQIYVVSIQEKESFDSENGEVFTSYSGDPIHGLTQIDAPAEVRVIKNGLVNGTVVVMWESVEKSDLYRVGIIPNANIIGTGKYNVNETEARLYGLDPVQTYKIYVIAENTNFGLVSKKTYSTALALNPMATATGVGPARGGPNTKLKGVGEDAPTLFGEFELETLLEGSGEDEEPQEEPALNSTWTTVIIIGSVLLFLLLCVIIPCIVECRKCRREGHCCCFCCSNDDDDEMDDMQAEASSLERQRKKAKQAGYDDF